MITATGLGSGLDVSGLVKQLVEAERAGSDLQLNRKSSKLSAKLSAFGSLKGVAANFKSSMSGLNSLNNFDKKAVTLSSTDAFTATATNAAVPNSYNVEVQQLAAAQALASSTYADSDSAIVGNGTLTFRFGSIDYNAGSAAVDGFSQKAESKVTTLTIDSSNNTLEGIMKAVNDADFGVQASVVNDGVGYRLLFTSTATGQQNAIEIAVSDIDGNNTDTSGLSNLAFNTSAANISQTKASADALFTLNGLAVTSTSNTVTSAIAGVSLNLKALTGGAVKMSVSKDSTAVVAAVTSFINGYNQFTKTVKALTKYDPATNTAGMLIGDFTVRSMVSQVDAIMRNAVSGIAGEFGSLAEVGLSTNNLGEYSLDTARFKSALESSPQSMQALFSALGIPSDQDVLYNNSTKATQTGVFDVDISNLASSGLLTGAGVLPVDFGITPLTIDNDNDALTLNVDGVDVGEILITQGSYTNGNELATEIQARINGASALVAANKTVKVIYDAGTASFSISSTSLGSSSSINITAVDTNSASMLGLDVAEGTAGMDVSGSIDGIAALGAGSILTAADGTAAKGLQLTINGSSTGARGSVNFSRGIVSQLDFLLEQMLDEQSGLNDRIDNIKSGLTEVEERRSALELRWQKVQDRYTRQFNALDTLLSGLQSTSSYLESQLAALPGPRKQNN